MTFFADANMKTLIISFCVLFLLMMSALPVSATPAAYFGEVGTLEDGSKMISLMVRDVNNLGSCDAVIKFDTSEGVEITEVTPGNVNALTDVLAPHIENINTEGSVTVKAWDESTAHSGDVVICNVVYKGSDSNPFEIDSVKLFEYTNDNIRHTGNNDIDRSPGTSTVNPTTTKVADDSATSIATVSKGDIDRQGAVVKSTEIVDETNESSGENNNGIPGFGLLTGLSVMFIAVWLLRENK